MDFICLFVSAKKNTTTAKKMMNYSRRSWDDKAPCPHRTWAWREMQLCPLQAFDTWTFESASLPWQTSSRKPDQQGPDHHPGSVPGLPHKVEVSSCLSCSWSSLTLLLLRQISGHLPSFFSASSWQLEPQIWRCAFCADGFSQLSSGCQIPTAIWRQPFGQLDAQLPLTLEWGSRGKCPHKLLNLVMRRRFRKGKKGIVKIETG